MNTKPSLKFIPEVRQKPTKAPLTPHWSSTTPAAAGAPKEGNPKPGTIPERYLVQEHPSGSYEIRTEANVKDSDGTLIFTYGKPSGGTGLALEYAVQYRKPNLTLFEFDQFVIDPMQVWE